MKNKVIFGLILLSAAAGPLYWFTAKSNKDQMHYLTETVTKRNIFKTVNASGGVAAENLVTVGSQASGKIITLKAVVGMKVKKGDLIAQIDPTNRENDLKSAKAELVSLQAKLESAKVARKIAQTKYNRELKLRKTDSNSKANLEDAENTLASTNASLSEIQASIAKQEIAVNTAETNLGYTKIAAPLDGTIVSVPVKEGQTVNANQTTPTIAQIADLRKMEIKIEISEGDIPFIKKGMNVKYTLLGKPDTVYKTVISSIDPGDKTLSDSTGSTSSSSSSSSSSTTSTNAIYYYAKAKVDNTEDLLRINMTTQNIIEIEGVRNVLALPSLVIQKGKRGKSTVRVLESDGTIIEKQVELGLSNNVLTEIRSGLNEGEKVIATEMSADEYAKSLKPIRGGKIPMR